MIVFSEWERMLTMAGRELANGWASRRRAFRVRAAEPAASGDQPLSA